jgi:hypothetical protein|tara:strand:- start:1757 stop:2509 length:753 start_codon:yes stop_codon:yes gene_type:complete
MKYILNIVAFLFVISTYGQTAMSRTIDVKDGQMDKFIQMAGKKTKQFNGQDANTQFYTWQILTGPNAGKIWRVEVGESLASFDTNPYNSPGGKFWQKNVAPTIADNNVSRTVTWGRAAAASWSPDNPTNDLMRRAIFYSYKASHEDDFWTYRTRIVEARKALNDQSSPSTSTWWCGSGCDGPAVVVFFSHADYEDQMNDNQGNQVLWDKYDEIYGEGSHEQDVSRMVGALTEGGQRIRHLMLIPEASSDN